MLDHLAYAWTMGDGVVFVRDLSNQLQLVGWEVALGGSVLKKGRSMNDLDVVLFPRTTAHVDLDAARAAMKEWGMIQRHDKDWVHKAWRKQGSKDEKHVEVWEYKDKRVDLFFLR
jgi:hypothetical protein